MRRGMATPYIDPLLTLPYYNPLLRFVTLPKQISLASLLMYRMQYMWCGYVLQEDPSKTRNGKD